MANAFFTDLLSTISERGRTLLRRGAAPDTKQDASDLIELCEALLSGRGEASGTAMAREVLDRYHGLDAGGRRSFFKALVRDFGPDREKVAKARRVRRSRARACRCLRPAGSRSRSNAPAPRCSIRSPTPSAGSAGFRSAAS